MKVAVTAQGDNLETSVDPRFGRCSYFIFADLESNSFEAIPNPAQKSGGGAGINTAQLVISKGAEVVITGQVGPNALQVLNSSKVKIYYVSETETVKSALEKLKTGQL